MRQIILDTETTGLQPERGHRVIEVGGVELVNRRLTGHNYHEYLQPDREIDEAARDTHGITLEFLAGKPRFIEISDSLLEYLGDAELVIHNASFDIGFLNHEFRRVHGEAFDLAQRHSVVDTLLLAQEKHPGVQNSLDALCKRYRVDNSGRVHHGALLDSEILAEVYLAMTGGQSDLSLDALEHARFAGRQDTPRLAADRPPLPIIRPNADEHAAHRQYLQKLQQETGRCVWQTADPPLPPQSG